MNQRRETLMKSLFPVILAVAIALPLSGCGGTVGTKYAMSFFDTFDTVVTIQGYASGREAFDRVTAQAQDQFVRYHRIFDKYHEYEGINNLCTVNRTASLAPVTVPEELFNLISYCRDTQPLLGNTVNVAMGAVLQLWHDAREAAELDPPSASLPDASELLAASQHADMNSVVLDRDASTVYIRDPLLKLDLGAVAKGYATELVARFMLGSEMPSFIINAGGNIRAGEPPRDGRKNWAVAIQDPDGFVFSAAGSDILDTLYLSGRSVVTSGDYQRYFVVGEERYHHIVSPDTLMPSRHMRSVTVVTEDSGYADLLSTALFLMPYEKGRAFVQELEGVDVFWVLNDRSVAMTEGAKAMSKSLGATPY